MLDPWKKLRMLAVVTGVFNGLALDLFGFKEFVLLLNNLGAIFAFGVDVKEFSVNFVERVTPFELGKRFLAVLLETFSRVFH